MTLVVDASIVIAGSLPDEKSDIAQSVLDRIVTSSAYAPGIFVWEVANVLSIAVRRNRLSFEEAEGILEDVADLNVICDPTRLDRIWVEVFGLSQRHSLSVYDAGYLELARRMKLPLATLDKRLAGACLAEGIEVICQTG